VTVVAAWAGDAMAPSAIIEAAASPAAASLVLRVNFSLSLFVQPLK
jgi:hypothetical protein